MRLIILCLKLLTKVKILSSKPRKSSKNSYSDDQLEGKGTAEARSLDDIKAELKKCMYAALSEECPPEIVSLLTELQSHPLSDQPIVARLQYIPTYAQKIRTHYYSFAREMATEPQSKTRLAEICNRLGSAESLLSSTQLETDKSVDEFLQAEIALSAAQEALRIAQEVFRSRRSKDEDVSFSKR